MVLANETEEEYGKGKSKNNNGIFKNCSRIENSKVPNNILPFSLTFRIAERFLYFDSLEVSFNKFEDYFCLPAASLVNFPFSL